MGDELPVPTGWRYVSLGELEEEGVISEIQDGNHGERHPKSTDYVPVGVPFIMAKDLEGGRLNLRDCSFIPKHLADSLRIGFAKPGDVLLTHKATMGRVAIVPDGFGYVMLTPQVTYYRIADTERLSNVYLKYAFLGPDFQHQLNSDSEQSTRKYIGITAQRRLRIPFPPSAEQRAIAIILGTLDEKIELNRRMNETLEGMARTNFKSWFVDFDPVRAKAEGHDPGLPKHIADLFPNRFEDSELGEIPAGWKVKTISNVAERVGMGPFGSSIKVETFIPEGVPIISGQHLNGFMLEDNKFNFISVEHAERLSNSNVQRGDVVFTHAGNIGQAAYIPECSRYERYVLSQRQFFMRCDRSQVTPSFIAIYFNSSEGQHQLLANASSSGVPSIARPVTYLRTIKLVIPPKSILNAFDKLTCPILLRFRRNFDESDTLSALRDKLLPKLISGELRLKDPERFVAERGL